MSEKEIRTRQKRRFKKTMLVIRYVFLSHCKDLKLSEHDYFKYDFILEKYCDKSPVFKKLHQANKQFKELIVQTILEIIDEKHGGLYEEKGDLFVPIYYKKWAKLRNISSNGKCEIYIGVDEGMVDKFDLKGLPAHNLIYFVGRIS